MSFQPDHSDETSTAPGLFRTSGAPPFYQAGQHILWREWCPTRANPEVVRPVTVVQDDAFGLVVWLSGGSPVFRAVLSDGREFRETPLHERHRGGRASKRDTWRGNGVLKIAPTGVPWSVWLFWDEQWNHRCWYLNLEDSHLRDADGVVTRDHELDVVMHPDGEVEVKDEDDLAAAVAAGRFTHADAAQFAVDARTAIRDVQAGNALVSDQWVSWRPEPKWPTPHLPTDLTSDF